jgi:uncharacterized protein YndB with AHSA1/START domain
MKITIETLVKADLNTVWTAWNNPEDIKQWNAASDDWHTTQSTVDLREGARSHREWRQKTVAPGSTLRGRTLESWPRR